MISKYEEMLDFQLRAYDLPKPVREHRFHGARRWRFDFAWPAIMLAVEIDGVTAGAGGRHQRISGFRADCDKMNAAVMDGWRVLRFTPDHVKAGNAIMLIQQAHMQVAT